MMTKTNDTTTRGDTARVMRFWSLALASSLAACSSTPTATPATPATAEAAVTVTTSLVRSTAITDAFDAGGVVRARTTAVLSARLVAPVLEVRAAPGDRVRAGQVLVTLDGRDLQAHTRAANAATAAANNGVSAAEAEVRSAEASLTLARVTYDRVAALHAKRSATAQELDQATAALHGAQSHVQATAARVKEAASVSERARAASDAAQATEAFLRLTSPFDGLVTEKMVEPGNMATPGQPLLRVEDTRGFRVDVRVDESRAARLSAGAAVDVVLDDEPARPILAGTVSEVSRAVDADERASLIKVDLPADAAVRSGAYARVRLPAGTTRSTLVVPAEAILTQGQVTSVFVVENRIARLRLVRLRDREVLAGLAEGDVVIVSPPAGLVDGRPVETGGSR